MKTEPRHGPLDPLEPVVGHLRGSVTFYHVERFLAQKLVELLGEAGYEGSSIIWDRDLTVSGGFVPSETQE